MNQHNPCVIIVFTTLICWVAMVGMASPVEYEEYKRASSKELLFKVVFNEDHIGYVTEHGDTTEKLICGRSLIEVHEHEVTLDDELLFDRHGIQAGDRYHPFDEIHDIHIFEEDDFTVISFYTRTGEDRRTGRIRRGNIIDPAGPIVIQEDEFVRGVVFSVTGDVEVYGETSKDVLSLFGNVFVGPDAVIRGDVTTISGRLDIARDASIYGETYRGSGRRTARGHLFYRRRQDISVGIVARYNRVDGLALSKRSTYKDPDSLLPSVWTHLGYAFESERWRYDIGLEQTILRSLPLAIGGSAYRELISEDDWLLTLEENTVFALVATEDFMDYYEAEGGKAYLKSIPWDPLTLECGYRYEKTTWLEAELDLWSLFGGDKKFTPNFAGVEPLLRQQGIAEIDTTTNSCFYGRFDLDTRDENYPYDLSAWAITGTVEWSHPDFQSDFDYRRYTVSMRRYQKFHRRTMLLLRGTYGGSDGYLPMYKRFYLGGLGTLRGYRHKEFSGTRFWMANAEYRISFPRTDVASSLFWDIGQIAERTRFDSQAEIRNSLGVSVCIGDDFRMSLAKRLDRSTEDDPKFYARFAHVF